LAGSWLFAGLIVLIGKHEEGIPKPGGVKI